MDLKSDVFEFELMVYNNVSMNIVYFLLYVKVYLYFVD